MSKSHGAILITVLVCALVSAKTPHSKELDKDKNIINWVPYSSGIAQAKVNNKPVFLHFYADWCAFCTKMAKETFKDRTVIKHLNANFISIRVDYDKEKDIAEEYRVRGFPTSILIDSKGKRRRTIPGYISAEKLLAKLKKIE
ncbi:thioredoxin family protein [Thermodesulfobacteriota bacterium]